MNVNKKNIANLISKSINVKNDVSKEFLDEFLEIIKINFRNKSIKISGFWTFFSKITKERVGINPKTKESYIIPKSIKLNFNVSQKIKKIIN